MYAFLQAQAPSLLTDRGNMSDTAWRQVLQKQLLRFAQDSGKRAGTDLGLETQLHSNANVDAMLPAANKHVLQQDLGILRRDVAQTLTMPEPSGTGDVVKHLKNFSNDTDPRGFFWGDYDKGERDAILKEVGSGTKAREKLDKAIELGHQHGLFQVPAAAPKAATAPPPAAAPPPAVVAPAMPPPNPLLRPVAPLA
jgi:hypothetical protein